jgi:predicted metal-dependent phosphoesterase TrpH
MIIDLHIHSKNCSDGTLFIEEIIEEAKARNIGLMSITDHDIIGCQKKAEALAKRNSIHYVYGIELSVSLIHPKLTKGKLIPLDFLSYKYDINNSELKKKLQELRNYREERAAKILELINTEFKKEGVKKLTITDWNAIRESADGVVGRPHIADYLVKKRIVKDRQEAFDKYLVKCNVPKYPLYVEEAARLMRNAGGIVVLAHPNDFHGISLVKLTNSLQEQTKLIEELLLKHIDGIECWHSRSNSKTTKHYIKFAKKHGLIMTGGSDCHQKPILMGTVQVPDFVAEQFIKQKVV